MTLHKSQPVRDQAGAAPSPGRDPRQPGPPGGRRSVLDAVRARPLAWAVAFTAPVAYGLLAGLWTPRGPHTAAEGLTAMALSVATGLLAGRLLRSRWAMLVAPLLFVTAFEVTRLSVAGPSVDGIHLGSEYGILAFLVGRGVHGVLAVLPMMLGAALGAAIARRTSSAAAAHRTRSQSVFLWLRRSVAVVTGLALVALAVLVARPATTDPILDADGEPLEGSVAELTQVDVGGHELDLMIRGDSVANPVLLFLAGGPGGSELGAMRRHSQSLEQDFVVATLDQRGTGKSYDELDPTSTLTLEAAVDDALGVTNYLRDRFGQDKVYLVGQSWGSLLGVLTVQQRPELFDAFVGVGQMVSPVTTDQVFYRDTLAWARESGNTGLEDTLLSQGPPPYTNARYYEPALSHEPELYPYDHSPNSEGAGQMGENIFVEEYTFLEKAHIFAGTLDVLSTLYPQIQDVDFREQATRLDVPVYLAQGAHEAPGRAAPAREWLASLDAPSKQLVEFETSGHRPLWEQPEEFHQLMTDTVLAETAAPD